MKLCTQLLIFILTVLIGESSAAEANRVSAARATDGSNPIGKRANPKFDLGAPAPAELTPSSGLLQTDVVRKTNELAIESGGEEKLSGSPVVLPNTMDGLNDTRRLGVGDRLSFKVVEDEIAPRSLVVTDSMELDVPYIGRVSAVNRSCKQFAYYVKSLLEKEYYYQATVLIGLDSSGAGTRAASRGKIYVMGQVRSPGAMDIPMDEPLTVTKAIIKAGGFGPYANKKNVRLVRSGKSSVTGKPIIINCAEILDKGLWDKDIQLNPEDIITVREKLINLF